MFSDRIHSLSTRCLFRAFELSSGISISKKLKALEVSQYWDRKAIFRLQEEKLRGHLAYANDNSEYWRGLFSSLDYSPDIAPFEFLHRLPIFGKNGLRQHMKKILVHGYRGKVFAQPSSGATGEPIVFYEDKRSRATIKAHLYRRWGWAGYRIGDPWIWIKVDVHKGLKPVLSDWALNCTYFPVYSLDRKGINESIEKCRGRHYAILRGYPNALNYIARLLLEEGMPGPDIGSIVTTGETLHQEQRQAIESAFKCSIHDAYAGDFFPIASQCPAKNYHLDEECTYTEIVDDDGNPLPHGQAGNVIVTEFESAYMPLFRYRLGDRATLMDGYCPCGRQLRLMCSVEGRDSDIIHFPGGVSLAVQFFVKLFKHMAGVNQYQVIQEEPLKVVYHLEVNQAYDRQRNESQLRHCLADAARKPVDVVFKYHDAIPLTRAGKRRFLISRVIEKERNS